MEAAQRRLKTLSRQVLSAASCSEVASYPEGTHFGILPTYEHPIRCAPSGCLSAEALPPATLAPLLEQAAKWFDNEVALAVEKNPPPPESPGVAPSLPWKDWKKWTWRDYNRDARRLAKALMDLGVEQFGSVTIFGFNSPEWVISSMAAIVCGAKYVGIYGTDTPDQVQYKVAHTGAAVAVVDGRPEYDSVASKVAETPDLKAVIAWGMAAPTNVLKRSNGTTVRVLSFDDALKMGDVDPSHAPLNARIAQQKPGHAAAIIYTSGTTGNPKAVMIHHDAIMAQGAVGSLPETGMRSAFTGGGARLLSYLPLSHIAGGLMDILNPLYFAGKNKLRSTVYFARPNDLKDMTLAARIQFVKPTIFLAVPRVFEKIQARMMAVSATITGVKKSLAVWARGRGLEYARNLQVGGSQSKPLLHGVAERLVLSKARQALGLDECKVFITGAAPISLETLEYFGSLGMMIQNVYGMSESSGVTTLCTPARNRFGTVGAALPGLEVKCFRPGKAGENVEVPQCEPGLKVIPEEFQGELCYRGRHIMMGYMANPNWGAEHHKEIEEKNRGAIDSLGWLHSGDKGCIDTYGMVRITGRYKELIIGAGGENIAPVPVEENLKQVCPALSNVMMVGDNRKYNVALVTLQAEGSTGELPGGDDLAGVALQVNPKVTKVSQALQDPVWLKYIQDGINLTNDNPTVCQNNAWKIQKFAIVPRDFSIETGELTATLKLRRSVAEEIWSDLISSLYTD